MHMFLISACLCTVPASQLLTVAELLPIMFFGLFVFFPPKKLQQFLYLQRFSYVLSVYGEQF